MKKNLRAQLRSKYQFDHEGPATEPSDTAAPASEPQQSHTTLPLRMIHPNPQQPRQTADSEKFEELKQSIAARGLLQPIRVREIQVNKKYEIIAGERRWRAASALKLKDIPVVIVRDQSPDQAYIDALAENLIREDLNPIDRAEALKQIRTTLGLSSWAKVAEVSGLGISTKQITNLVALTTLPDDIQNDIRSGILSEKHGRALRTLADTPDIQARSWQHVKAQQLSGDSALDYVRQLKQGTPKAKGFNVSYRTDKELAAALEAKLSELQPGRSQDNQVQEEPGLLSWISGIATAIFGWA